MKAQTIAKLISIFLAVCIFICLTIIFAKILKRTSSHKQSNKVYEIPLNNSQELKNIMVENDKLYIWSSSHKEETITIIDTKSNNTISTIKLTRENI